MGYMGEWDRPSGKLRELWKDPPFWMGKSSISMALGMFTVTVYIAMERSTIFSGKTHYKTMAMFNGYVTNYQKVNGGYVIPMSYPNGLFSDMLGVEVNEWWLTDSDFLNIGIMKWFKWTY